MCLHNCLHKHYLVSILHQMRLLSALVATLSASCTPLRLLRAFAVIYDHKRNHARNVRIRCLYMIEVCTKYVDNISVYDCGILCSMNMSL